MLISEFFLTLIRMFRKWWNTKCLLKKCRVKMPEDGMEVLFYKRQLYDRKKYIRLRAEAYINMPVSEICKKRQEDYDEYHLHRTDELLLANVESMDLALSEHDYGR